LSGTDRRVKPTQQKEPGRIRIIGGRLRGSRLEVPAVAGLRPTPDRLRETLFNWLAPWIDGARCLDLFAGTGALGIEAWSRQAAAVTFVERDAALAGALRANLQRLKVHADVAQGDVASWLQGTPSPYDIVFLDPPFDADLWQATASRLDPGGWLAPNALIYVESPREPSPVVPAAWRLWRETSVGAVRGAVYRRGA
jgi:16S rRNA (guanine966-N2)-methyltransferase